MKLEASVADTQLRDVPDAFALCEKKSTGVIRSCLAGPAGRSGFPSGRWQVAQVWVSLDLGPSWWQCLWLPLPSHSTTPGLYNRHLANAVVIWSLEVSTIEQRSFLLFILKIFICLFTYLTVLGLSCGRQDLQLRHVNS